MRDETGSDIARLTDYVTGEGSREELVATGQWIAEQEDRANVAERFEQMHTAVQVPLTNPSADSEITDRVIHAVFARLQAGSFQRVNDKQRTTIQASGPTIPFTSIPATRLYLKSLLGIGGFACLLVLALSGRPVFDAIRSFSLHKNASSIATTQEYIARPGEQVTVELVDGSRILLAAGSRMRYSTTFGQQDRTIHLSGRAFFDVRHNATLPFIVYAANSAVQVLGTSFVVSAYPADTTVQVVVRDGKVALRTSTAENATGVALTAGDLGALSRTGLVTVTPQVYLPQYTAWTERRLEFRETALSDIARELERRYDIIVSVHPALRKVPVTASFDKEPAAEALDRLAAGLRATVTHDGRQYRITP